MSVRFSPNATLLAALSLGSLALGSVRLQFSNGRDRGGELLPSERQVEPSHGAAGDVAAHGSLAGVMVMNNVEPGLWGELALT